MERRKKMKTKNEIRGYRYEYNGYAKKWKRGRVMFSTGRKYIGNNEYIPIIAKTNLDTGEVTEASLEEAKRFLTEEGYKEWLRTRFAEMAERS
jgi:hypothetical protein